MRLSARLCGSVYYSYFFHRVILLSDGAGDEAVLDGEGRSSAKANRSVTGGAFYDLASQGLTPLVGGRGSMGLSSNSVQGSRAGSSAPPVRIRGLITSRNGTLLRGTIVYRTYATHKNQYTYLFLLTVLDPTYYGPPW